MATNLIANGNFSDGDLHWTKGYWYAGNTVTWRSSGGQEGGCMELSVPSVGDPGSKLHCAECPSPRGNYLYAYLLCKAHRKR